MSEKWTQLGNLDIRLGKIEQNDKARKNTYVEARCTETLALLKKATFFPKLIFIHRRKSQGNNVMVVQMCDFMNSQETRIAYLKWRS